MVINVKACQEGEAVMVLDDGRIILGEAGNVALTIADPDREEAATITLNAAQAWELAVALARESRIARSLAQTAGGAKVTLRSILGGKR